MKERYNSGEMTVNYKNIDYLIVEKVQDRYIVYYEYRPKIKVEQVVIKNEFINLQKLREFMSKYNFHELGNYFINVDNYSMVEEISYNTKSKRYIIKFYMRSNVQFELSVTRDAWTSFKNNKLL